MNMNQGAVVFFGELAQSLLLLAALFSNLILLIPEGYQKEFWLAQVLPNYALNRNYSAT